MLEIEGLLVECGAGRRCRELSGVRGRRVGLLGPNGVGKTSILSAVEGLVAPRAGRVAVAGLDIRQQPVAARAQLGV